MAGDARDRFLGKASKRGVGALKGYGQASPLSEAVSGFVGAPRRFSVMDPQAQEMQQARDLGEQASVASQLYGALAPFAAGATIGKAGQMAGISPLTVYHGSPHRFSKFDASKIGTGEGAQAYGHGLYFAENPKVAKDYADVLASPRNMVSDKRGVYIEPSPVTSGKYMLATKSEVGQPYGVAGDATQFIYADYEFPNIASAIKFAKRQGLLSKNDRPRLTAIGEDRKYIPVTKASDVENPEYTQFIASDPGRLYTVDLPDEKIARMLDWDKPLSEQSKAVQEFADKILNDPRRKQAGFTGGKTNAFGEEMTGADFYNTLTPTWLFGGEKGGVEAARQAGIPGIRYLDQGSRGNYRAQTTYKGKPYGDVVSFATQKQLDDYVAEKTAEGFGVNKLPQSSNFVIFPNEEDALKILDVYAKGGAVKPKTSEFEGMNFYDILFSR